MATAIAMTAIAATNPPRIHCWRAFGSRMRPSAKAMTAGTSTPHARHRTTDSTPPVLAENEIVSTQK